MHTPIANKRISHNIIGQFRGPYSVIGAHTSRTGVLERNIFDLIRVKPGMSKSANAERWHLCIPPLAWLATDNANRYGGLPILRALSLSLGTGVRIWFRWDPGWAAAMLEHRANKRERLREADGTYVSLGNS